MIFVPTGNLTLTNHNTTGILNVFKSIKLLHNALIYTKNDRLKIRRLRIDGKILERAATYNVDLIFPDPLKNLHQYIYKVIVTSQYPRSIIQNGKLISVDTFFIDTVAKLQNASYKIERVDQRKTEGRTKIVDLMVKNIGDIFLNTMPLSDIIKTRNVVKTVNTFQTNGYCALIPLPRRVSYLRYLLTAFDIYTRILLLLSVAAAALVWKTYQCLHPLDNVDSVGYFVLGTIANFLHQAISFQNKASTLQILIQTNAVMFFILGNYYQSLMISSITEPHFEPRIKTIDEMLVKHKLYLVEKLFNRTIFNLDLFPTMERTVFGNVTLNQLDFKVSADIGTVLIVRCDMAEAMFKGFLWSNPSVIKNFYYMLPQTCFNFYEKYSLSVLSPFEKRLNEISLKIFETGIKQHWKTLMMENVRTNYLHRKNSDLPIEYDFMNLKDLAGIFYLCSIFMFLATVVFVVELLWHRLKRSKLGKTLQNAYCRVFRTTNQRAQPNDYRIEIRSSEPAVVLVAPAPVKKASSGSENLIEIYPFDLD